MTADEVAAMEKKQGSDPATSGQENAQSGAVMSTENRAAGHKRKSSEVNDDSVTAPKKSKAGASAQTSAGAEESEPESADASDEDG